MNRARYREESAEARRAKSLGKSSAYAESGTLPSAKDETVQYQSEQRISAFRPRDAWHEVERDTLPQIRLDGQRDEPAGLEERLEFLSSFDEPLVLLDVAAQIRWCNQPAALALGLSGPTFPERSLLSYIEEAKHVSALEQLRALASGDYRRQEQVDLTLVEGGRATVLLRPLIDGTHFLALLVCPAQPDAVRQAEIRLELGLHGARCGFWKWNLELDTVFYSSRWLGQLGYPGDVAGLTWESLVHDEDRQKLLRNRNDQAVHSSCEIRLRTHAGEFRWFKHHALISERDELGRARCLMGIDVDIGERKAVEEAQRKLQAQLARSERMANVGLLAAGVAHEINNPLAYILSNLTFAIECLSQSELSGERRLEILEALRETRDGAERVRDIVGDLKTFSRGDDKKLGPVDVRKVLTSTINIAMNEIRHRAELVVDYGDIALVRGNEAQLGQVFLNLLVNAAHAIDAGGAQYNEIRVAARCSDDQVTVEISDTGSGIPPHRLQRIFEPFYTTKPVGVGTGLGLSICRNLVESLGGRIAVESSLGLGSTFRVSFPVAYTFDVEVGQGPVPLGVVNQRALKILIIDDEALVARSMRRSLGVDHDVRVATSSSEALSMMKRTRFDVILCDVMMPDMTGPELHSVVRRRDPALASRFIFVTGGAFDKDTSEHLARSGNRCLEKPFSTHSLLEMVAETAKLSGPVCP